ncbi:MAG: hypothetical protein AAF804_14030 [Bacteroidota bacterium]
MNRNVSFWLLSVLMLLHACQPTVGLSPSRCLDGKCTYTFVENAQLLIEEVDEWNVFLRSDSGANLVFTYLYTANQDPHIIDDEYGEQISFEINPALDSIHLENRALRKIQLAFIPSCECAVEVVEIRSGRVTGQKLNENQWEFSLDLEFKWAGIPQTRNISGVFERET